MTEFKRKLGNLITEEVNEKMKPNKSKVKKIMLKKIEAEMSKQRSILNRQEQAMMSMISGEFKHKVKDYKGKWHIDIEYPLIDRPPFHLTWEIVDK